MESAKQGVSDKEMRNVIADFLEMGHVENIVSMFRRYPEYYSFTGDLLIDERFNVRLGLTLLFEELQQVAPQQTVKAIPSLVELLAHESPLFRGEAIGILGIIGTDEAREHVTKMKNDPSPQVIEMAELVLSELR